MNLLEKILKIIDEKNAKDVKVYDLTSKSPFYDQSIVCTASSTRNAESMVTEIKKEIKKINGIEGTEEMSWVLIDVGDIIVNIFLEDTRNYYEIDEFYNEILAR